MDAGTKAAVLAFDAAADAAQHLRDEAHDTAVRFHRQRRNRRTLTSELDALPGVGPARRQALLQHFGSLRAIRRAPLVAFAQVPGIGEKVAAAIFEALHPDRPSHPLAGQDAAADGGEE